MGKAENRARSQAQAEYMKRMGITRKTGACPWGCGRQVAIGGQALVIHLNTCQGKKSKRK